MCVSSSGITGPRTNLLAAKVKVLSLSFSWVVTDSDKLSKQTVVSKITLTK